MKDTVAYTLEKGRPLTATIPATAGNVVYELTPGSGYILKIIYGRITLVTDVTVADRYFTISVHTAAHAVITCLGYSTVRAASGTGILDIVPVNAYGGTYVNPQGTMGAFLIKDFYIYDTDHLNITVNAGVAGDSYSGYIKYLLVKR